MSAWESYDPTTLGRVRAGEQMHFYESGGLWAAMLGGSIQYQSWTPDESRVKGFSEGYNLALRHAALAFAADAGPGWRSMDDAPRDGTRIVARGWDWGRPGNRRHLNEVVWHAEREEWRDAYDPDQACAYLTEWLSAAPAPDAKEEG